MELFNSTLISRLGHYASEHQTNWDTYVLPLSYFHNVQVHRPIKESPFSLALTRTRPRHVTVAPKCASVANDEDMPSLMYTSLKLVKRATELRKDAHKNVNLAYGGYKKDYIRRLRFIPIFQVGGYVFLD